MPALLPGQDAATKYSFSGGVNSYGEKYNDLFPASPSVTQPPASVPPPVAPAPGSGELPAGKVYGSTGNAELDAALRSAADAAKAASSQPDPNDPAVQAQIRAQTLASFQAEIDATNSLYATKLASAKVTGAGRLGSSIASEARGGLLGSDFGNAQYDTVTKGNEEIYAGIDAEKNAQVQAILSKSNDQARQDIAAKTAARAAGLDSYIKYLQDSVSRAQVNAKAAAAAVLQAGVDPTKLSPDQLNTYLTNYSISKDDLLKAYTEAKPAFDAAKTKAAADAQAVSDAHLKAGRETVAPGGTVIGADGKPIYTAPDKPATPPSSVLEFEYAQKSGYKGTYTQFLKETANLKNVQPKAPGSPKPTSGDITSMSTQLNAVRGTDGYISPTDWATAKQAWVGAGYPSNQFDSAFSAYKNPADKYN